MSGAAKRSLVLTVVLVSGFGVAFGLGNVTANSEEGDPADPQTLKRGTVESSGAAVPRLREPADLPALRPAPTTSTGSESESSSSTSTSEPSTGSTESTDPGSGNTGGGTQTTEEEEGG